MSWSVTTWLHPEDAWVNFMESCATREIKLNFIICVSSNQVFQRPVFIALKKQWGLLYEQNHRGLQFQRQQFQIKMPSGCIDFQEKDVFKLP